MKIAFSTPTIPASQATVIFSRYANGNQKIEVQNDAGQVVMTASVDPSIELALGQVAIKNWGENVGVEAALVSAGILDSAPMQHIRSGALLVPVYELAPLAITAISEQAPKA